MGTPKTTVAWRSIYDLAGIRGQLMIKHTQSVFWILWWWWCIRFRLKTIHRVLCMVMYSSAQIGASIVWWINHSWANWMAAWLPHSGIVMIKPKMISIWFAQIKSIDKIRTPNKGIVLLCDMISFFWNVKQNQQQQQKKIQTTPFEHLKFMSYDPVKIWSVFKFQCS